MLLIRSQRALNMILVGSEWSPTGVLMDAQLALKQTFMDSYLDIKRISKKT